MSAPEYRPIGSPRPAGRVAASSPRRSAARAARVQRRTALDVAVRAGELVVFALVVALPCLFLSGIAFFFAVWFLFG